MFLIEESITNISFAIRQIYNCWLPSTHLIHKIRIIVVGTDEVIGSRGLRRTRTALLSFLGAVKIDLESACEEAL